MAILRTVIKWPGVRSPVSVTYTASHGISPATAMLVINPQPNPPDRYGTLELGDGIRSLVLKDCVIDRIEGQQSGSGKYWTLYILDRRWRWLTGAISGAYNQRDNAGKLVPWTVRSLDELARLCLKAQKEKRFQLRLPRGLAERDGARLNRLLATGENFPPSKGNPPVMWDKLPPMVALQQVANEAGCRVAWDAVTDTVGVGPPGVGDGLPTGGVSVQVATEGVSAKPQPRRVALAGSFVRFQMRFPLEAVVRDWDGKWVPMDQATYAPRGKAGRVQVIDVYRRKETADGPELPMTGVIVNGVEYAGADLDAVLAAIPGDAPVTGEMKEREEGEGKPPTRWLRIAGKVWGQRFHIRADECHLGFVQQAEQDGAPDWSFCGGPSMFGVTATDRLTLDQAREMAQRDAFRCYRIRIDRPEWCRPGLKSDSAGQIPQLGDDPNERPYQPWLDPKYAPLKVLVDTETLDETVVFPPADGSLKPDDRRRIKVPVDSEDERRGRDGAVVPVGPRPDVLRRHQFILLDEMNDYLVPTGRFLAGEANVRGKPSGNEFGVPPAFYSGYSSRKAAECHGTYSRNCSGPVTFTGRVASQDTDFRDTRVFVPFSVNAAEHLVMFAQPLYRQSLWGVPGGGSYTEAQIWLECACYFDLADTNERVRPRFFLTVGGPAPDDWTIHEDVLVDVTGRYEGAGMGELGDASTNVFDATDRAKHYLEAMLAEYQIKGAATRRYNGLVPVSLTGKVQQVTWDVGIGGITTTAGLNTEFKWNAVPYEERRLSENLPPDRQSAAVNLAEYAKRVPPAPRPDVLG